MSTELRSINSTLTQTRFSSGNGTSIQLTQTNQEVQSVVNPLGVGYIQLTRAEAAQVAAELQLFAAGREVEAE